MQLTRHLVNSLSAAAVLLLLAQLGIYVWLAPRAFEFTDEAFYLLNLLHWRDLQGNVTFFGAYFDIPFRALGQSIVSIRLFSVVLLLACSAYCTLAVLRYQSAQMPTPALPPTAVFVVAGMAGSMLYFSILSTLRVPSYNLGALCAGMIATGILLNLLSPPDGDRASVWRMLAYGLALGACGLNKASAGLAVAVMHAVFLLSFERPWFRANGLRLIALGAAGVAVNLVGLTLAAPNWFRQLQEGVALVSITDGRSLFAFFNHVRWDLQTVVGKYWNWAALAVLVYLGGVWVELRRHARPTGTPELLLVVAATAALAGASDQSVWWPVVVLVALLLTLRTVVTLNGPRLAGLRVKQVALVLLLLILPLALSFGTNMPVLAHAKTNAAFAVLAVLAALVSAARETALPRPTLVAALAVLCLPGLAYQWRAATQADQSYRQMQPLAEQHVSVLLGMAQTRLQVDSETARGLQEVGRVMFSAGWTMGTPVLDFTGDGPGWIYAMGGQPVGLAWLLGGYPGSEKTAARVLQVQAPELLQRSWLLTSDANPRRISNWRELLAQRLGANTHEKVATVMLVAPYRWGPDAPARIDLQLWRPLPR